MKGFVTLLQCDAKFAGGLFLGKKVSIQKKRKFDLKARHEQNDAQKGLEATLIPEGTQWSKSFIA